MKTGNTSVESYTESIDETRRIDTVREVNQCTKKNN